MNRFAPLAHRHYRRWAAADFLSVIGTWMQSVAAGWLVLDTTGSATRTGVMIAAQALPSLVLGPLAGKWADQARFNIRRLLVGTQISLALTTSIAAMGAFGFYNGAISSLALANLLTFLAFCNGSLHAIEGPSLGHLALSLIGKSQIPAALSLGALLSSTGRIIGTAGAGAIAFLGVPLIFLFNALTFLVVAATLASIPMRRALPHSRKVVGILGRRLWLLLGLSVVLGGLGRNYQVTMAALSNEEGFGASGYAATCSTFAIGAALGGALAVVVSQKRMRYYFALAITAGVLQIAVGRVGHLHQVLAILLPIAICAVLLDVTFNSIMLQESKAEVRGRVIALQGIAAALGGALGAPILGYLAERWSASSALEIAGLICLISVVMVLSIMSRDLPIGVFVKAWTRVKTPLITSLPIMRSSETPSRS